METNRRIRLENQIIFLFIRTTQLQYRSITVDLDLDENDFTLQSIFEYLYSMYRLLYC